MKRILFAPPITFHLATTLSGVVELILVPLADNPALGAKPLAWSLALWGEGNPWFSADDWQDFYRRGGDAQYLQWSSSGIDQEQIYIAMRDGEVVGAIALVDFDDIEEFRELKPWVAAFVVDPALRKEGIGSAMLAAVENKARSFGIPELYLWTEDKKQFYLNRGYQLISHRDYPEISIDVMKKIL